MVGSDNSKFNFCFLSSANLRSGSTLLREMLPIHTIMAARFLVHTHSYSSECIFHIQLEGNTLNKICLIYMRLRCNATY